MSEPFEEKLKIYKLAKMPQKAILEKIESEFGFEAKLKAQNLFLAEEAKNSSSSRSVFLMLMGVIGIFIVASLFVIIISSTPQQSFSSNKCSDVKTISINGNTEFQSSVLDALYLVENKNCSYLHFISDNYNTINSTSFSFFDASFYNNLKKDIPQKIIGSDYFVADLIILQACHSFQEKQGQKINEHDCALTQYNFLKAINAPSEDIAKVEALKNSLDYFFSESNTDIFQAWLIKN